MVECITKEYIRNIVQDHRDNSCGAECYAYGVVLDDIDAAPAVKEKRGRWVSTYPVTCSVCRCHAAMDYKYDIWLSPYCPNCGAHMTED